MKRRKSEDQGRSCRRGAETPRAPHREVTGGDGHASSCGQLRPEFERARCDLRELQCFERCSKEERGAGPGQNVLVSHVQEVLFVLLRLVPQHRPVQRPQQQLWRGRRGRRPPSLYVKRIDELFPLPLSAECVHTRCNFMYFYICINVSAGKLLCV